MNRNVGSLDRGIRAVVGISGLAGYFTGFVEANHGADMALVSVVVGAVMLGTAAIGWCPPYAIFGINSCSKD